MIDTERWLYFLMEGQMVERFHSRPFLKPITDGQHQHGVAMLCWYLTDGMCSANLLMAALTHDQAEQGASDVSYPTKQALNLSRQLQDFEDELLAANGMLFTIDEAEHRVLKLADAMEGMLECCRERFYGNKYVCLAMDRWLVNVYKQSLNETEKKVLSCVERIWKLANSDQPPAFDVFDGGNV